MEAIKRLPIGISDFKTLQRSQKYFVDKTKYLPKRRGRIKKRKFEIFSS